MSTGIFTAGYYREYRLFSGLVTGERMRQKADRVYEKEA